MWWWRWWCLTNKSFVIISFSHQTIQSLMLNNTNKCDCGGFCLNHFSPNGPTLPLNVHQITQSSEFMWMKCWWWAKEDLIQFWWCSDSGGLWSHQHFWVVKVEVIQPWFAPLQSWGTCTLYKFRRLNVRGALASAWIRWLRGICSEMKVVCSLAGLWLTWKSVHEQNAASQNCLGRCGETGQR